MIPGRECEECHRHYGFDPSNTVVVWYEYQVWMSFAESVCACGSHGRTFFRDNYEECMEFFITHDFEFVTGDFATVQIVKQFENAYGLHMAEEYSLTPRLEKEVRELGEVLEHTPDDLLMEVIQTPTPCDKPEMWQ